ncbi:hypothetical protein ACXU4B_10585 [Dyella soli]|uniref:hypothetical protein n=1 Tax=Dyella soli TaxID=522319 RepID=UPI0013F3BBC3|nr:hypothetical protein [Dyella soli]
MGMFVDLARIDRMMVLAFASTGRVVSMQADVRHAMTIDRAQQFHRTKVSPGIRDDGSQNLASTCAPARVHPCQSFMDDGAGLAP